MNDDDASTRERDDGTRTTGRGRRDDILHNGWLKWVTTNLFFIALTKSLDDRVKFYDV